MEKQDRFLIPKDKTQGRPYFLALLDPESQKEVDCTEYHVTPHQRAYKQDQLTDQAGVYKDTTQIESALSWSRELIRYNYQSSSVHKWNKKTFHKIGM